jgi:hypothetical protein
MIAIILQVAAAVSYFHRKQANMTYLGAGRFLYESYFQHSGGSFEEPNSKFGLEFW